MTRLSTTGLLRHEPADALHAWLDACIAASLVSVSTDRYRTLSLTTEGRQAMRGQSPIVKVSRPMPLRLPRLRRAYDDDGDDGAELLLVRRQLRSRWLDRYR